MSYHPSTQDCSCQKDSAIAVGKERIKRIADSLYISKIKYGLQLMEKVRTSDDNSKQGLITAMQLAQTIDKYLK